MTEEPIRFVDVAAMASDLGTHTRTIKRKAQSDPDFPPLTTYGGRLHAVASQWEKYKALLVSRGLATRPVPKPFPPEHRHASKNHKVPA